MSMSQSAEDLKFYQGKRVLITGHTGFKGTWMLRMLLGAGAVVCGYSLEPPTEPNLFSLAGFAVYEKSGQFRSVIADIRNGSELLKVFANFQPEIVFHLAAQPIVRDSYMDPVYTYETNVMGTVHVLEAIRQTDSVRSAVIITTDKVYLNREWMWGYREDEQLDGFDPYSNSKSCAELAVHSYCNSFFAGMDGVVDARANDAGAGGAVAPDAGAGGAVASDAGAGGAVTSDAGSGGARCAGGPIRHRYLAVSTARAGNVIGGGDFAHDRIIPDCVRTMEAAFRAGVEDGTALRDEAEDGVEEGAVHEDAAHEDASRASGVPEAMIHVRNPYSTRPFQHVLEPLAMYLRIGRAQWDDRSLAGWYNVGPDDCDCVTTGELVTLFCEAWNGSSAFPHASWESAAEANAPHEANFLKLDSTKIKTMLGYQPRWHIRDCMEMTVAFSKLYLTAPERIPEEMDREIAAFVG